MRYTRAGFTLIEIMVSLMIFIIVSGAMVSILTMSSELFRRGEFSRAANDETIAVLGALSDDINHAVPESGDGWLFGGIPSLSGNTLIAFTTAGQNTNGLGSRGQNARTIVAWWVEEKNKDEPPTLRRIVLDDTLDILDFMGSLLTQNGIQNRKVTKFKELNCQGYDKNGIAVPFGNKVSSVVPGDEPYEINWFARRVIRELARNPRVVDLEFKFKYDWESPTEKYSETNVDAHVIIPSTTITEGCLHFGAWLAVNEIPGMVRPKIESGDFAGQPDWEQLNIDSDPNTKLGPWANAINSPLGAESYDTRPERWTPNVTGGVSIQRKPPYPSALRVSLVLSGGSRYAPRGTLQKALTAANDEGTIPYAGLTGLPSLAGSMVRINDEWIAYQKITPTGLEYDIGNQQNGPGRGARRSTVAAHERGSPIRIGQSYSLVKALPR
jgi:prepilin-type N-terminal cleavage/methylation domain-containing protein